VVLAVSDEGDDLVSKYVDDMGITGVRVGAGFTGGGTRGVGGGPPPPPRGPPGAATPAPR
jgi:hypothetical protein